MAGQKVYLRDIWPSPESVEELVETVLLPSLFQEAYRNIEQGNEAYVNFAALTESSFSFERHRPYSFAKAFHALLFVCRNSHSIDCNVSLQTAEETVGRHSTIFSLGWSAGRRWRELKAPEGTLLHWPPHSTYIHKPPFFKGMTKTPAPVQSITRARCLLLLGTKPHKLFLSAAVFKELFV